MDPGKPRRKMRNFLLDKRFQLKYTLAIVFVSCFISTVLGYFIYQAHIDLRQAHHEIYQAQRESSELVALAASDPELKGVLSEILRKEDEAVRARHEALRTDDRKVLLYLVAYLGMLVLCLSLVGILATHKIAGPAYSLRRTLHEIAEGRLPVGRQLRRGDELKYVAEELQRVIKTLRDNEEREIDNLTNLVTAIRDQSKSSQEIKDTLETWILRKKERLGNTNR